MSHGDDGADVRRSRSVRFYPTAGTTAETAIGKRASTRRRLGDVCRIADAV